MTDEPHRVLVAEDDVRDATAYVLEHAGYAVVAAPTGDAALVHLLESDDFSLPLTDIRMPGSLDGWLGKNLIAACHPSRRWWPALMELCDLGRVRIGCIASEADLAEEWPPLADRCPSRDDGWGEFAVALVPVSSPRPGRESDWSASFP